MLPLLGSMITGGSSIIGSMFGADNNAKNIEMQRETNQMNIDQNRENRAWQEMMSNSAYRRSSQDMTAAGLNPMMMFSSGSAASSPAGGTPNIQAPRMDTKAGMANIGEAADKFVSGAISMKTFDKMTEEIANLREQQARTAAETDLTKQRKETEVQETVKRGAESSLRQMELPGARVRAREMENVPGWLIDQLAPWTYGSEKSTKMTDQIGSMIGSATGLKRMLKGSRSTSETSRQDSKGNWYDEFRENKSW